MTELKKQWPGQDLITEGLRDLALGVSSASALLVLIGAPRLRRLGIPLPAKDDMSASPEHDLYLHLQRQNANDAHSRYNALIRRLVSFERALEKFNNRSS